METLVDDVGSFPLPSDVDRELFSRTYARARQEIIEGKDATNSHMLNSFYRVVIDSFTKKCFTDLDVVNYPQHYDMHNQVTDLVYEAMAQGTYTVDRKKAIIPEVHVIKKEARRLYEYFGKKILLRVCIAGPLEVYLKVVGVTLYHDALLMLAETVKRFAENSVLNSKYVKTEVVSLDEPSFGYQNMFSDRDVILDAFEKAFSIPGVTRQIHLHSSSRIAEVLSIKNLDVLSLEFGASPKNIESLSRKTLDKADKLVRVGIARTDIDAINAELHDSGIANPTPEQMVESEETIRRRFIIAKKKFGDRMAFTGPDCGLGGWPTQESAQLLLRRTVTAVKNAKISAI